MGFSTFTAVTGIILLMLSAIYNNVILDYFASILIAPAIIMVFGINIYTWKKGQPDPITFNRMVKTELDQFFEKVNNHYTKNTKQGIKVATIDGHYWIELHIDQSKKIDEFDMASPDMQK